VEHIHNNLMKLGGSRSTKIEKNSIYFGLLVHFQESEIYRVFITSNFLNFLERYLVTLLISLSYYYSTITGNIWLHRKKNTINIV
jgi:hypothetical protein